MVCMCLYSDKIIAKKNNKSLRHTTKGWYFQVLWEDKISSWEPLKNLKEFNPVEVADHAVANIINEETALAWWKGIE